MLQYCCRRQQLVPIQRSLRWLLSRHRMSVLRQIPSRYRSRHISMSVVSLVSAADLFVNDVTFVVIMSGLYECGYADDMTVCMEVH